MGVTIDGSQGLDTDNTELTLEVGGSEKARIDSSGHLTVGKTSVDNGATAGHELQSNGYASHSRSGAVMLVNRLSSNGGAIVFRKDGSDSGYVGVLNTELYIASPSGSDSGLNFGSNRIIPCTTSGNNRDNIIDLGNSASRFNDLYLGGGVYVGGTGSANHLDDYEEGTWTPATNEGTLTAAYATYMKVGRIVVVTAFLNNFSNTTSTNGIRITGLPFTSSSGQRSVGSTMMQQISTNTIDNVYLSHNSSELAFYATTTGNFVHMKHSDLNSTSSEIYLTMTYKTES